MIFLRPFGVPNRFADNGYKFVGTFELFYKLSGKNHKNSLKSCEYYLDLFKKIKEKRTDIPIDHFSLLRSVLIRIPEINFNENDRLSYIDNENDEIPIDQQSDLTEAVIYSKFAQRYHKDKNYCVPLIITKAKEKPRKSSKKSKTTVIKSSNLAAETTEDEAAIQELQNCLKSYKKKIVAEVTHQVREEMTDELLKKMNMLLSQKMNEAENPSSSGTFQTFLPKIPKEPKIFEDDEDFPDAESLDAEFLDDDFMRSYGEFSSEMTKVEKMVKFLGEPMPGSEVPFNSFKKSSLPESRAPFSLDYDKSSSDEDTSSVDFQRMADLVIKRDYESLKTGKSLNRSIKHQLHGNNPSSKAEKAGPSGKSGNNDDNHDVNEKQHPSDSDNISLFSYPRCASAVGSGWKSYEAATPEYNVPISAFDAETREKSYEKNIAETSEATVIAPQLEKRSGGAYSHVPHILEESRENVFDVSSSKSAKSADKKFKLFRSDEEPRGVGFFGTKITAEQQKTPEDRETLQPRRRDVFDHNTAKGIGDTEQTSPEKRGAIKFGRSRRLFFFNFDCPFHYYLRYGCTRQPCCLFRPVYQPPFPQPFFIERPYLFYVDEAPSQLNEPQCPTGYHSSPETMQILPETLISGAAQAASSAYTTARKFIEKIRSPPPGSPEGPQPPKM